MNRHRRPPEPPVPDSPGYPRTHAAEARHGNPHRFGPVGWICVAAAAGIVVVGAYVVWRDDPARAAADKAAVVSTSKPTASAPPRRSPEYAPPASSVMGDGTWLLGKEVKRGLYSAPGGARCYWERVSDLSGAPEAIIDNAFGRSGPQKVALGKGDFAFTSQGCGTWVMVR